MSPEIKISVDLQQVLELQLQLELRQERLNTGILRHIVDLIKGHVRLNANDVLQELTLPMAWRINQLSTRKTEYARVKQRFIEAATRQAINELGPTFSSEVSKNPHIYDFDDFVEDQLTNKLPRIMKNLLRGQRKPLVNDEVYGMRKMLKAFEQLNKVPDSEAVRRVKKARIEKLKPGSEELLKQMYEPRRILPEDALYMVNNQSEMFEEAVEKHPFVAPGEDDEYEKLPKLLETTERLRQRKTQRRRREHETVTGRILLDPLTREPLSLVIHTVPPFDPKNEPKRQGEKTYIEELEKLFKGGNSGKASMRFGNPHNPRRKEQLLEEAKNGTMPMLYMMIGAIRLAVDYAMHLSVEDVIWICKDNVTKFRTYFLDHIEFALQQLSETDDVQKAKLETDQDVGMNIASMQKLTKYGYRDAALEILDLVLQDPSTSFKFTTFILHLFSAWQHVTVKAKILRKRTSELAMDFIH